MQALFPLISGIIGAPNGFANVYSRGTAQYARLYTTFEGDTNFVPTQRLQLDANGRYVTYVNEFVDVIAYDAAGNVVCEFGAGCAAPDMEVISQSFTGVDYFGAAAAAGKPTNLQAVLDLVKTSFGSTNFNVLVGGVSRTVQSALAAAGVFFNVKDTLYGAVGDGVADDTSAVQQAMTAAQAAGGGIVLLPTGSYRITAALNVGSKVSLMGVGQAASLLRIDHPTANALAYAAASTGQFVRDMTVSPLQSNSGKHVVLTGAAKLTLQDCIIGDVALTTGSCVSGDAGFNGGVVRSDRCTFYLGGGASYGVNCTNGYPQLLFCTFVLPATYNQTVVSGQGGATVIGCVFGTAGVSAGAFDVINIDSATAQHHVAILGNEIPNPTGTATATGIRSLTGGILQEGMNTIGALVALSIAGTGASGAVDTAGTYSATRETRRQYQASNAATVTLAAKDHKTVIVSRTTNTNQTLQLPDPPYIGASLTLAYINTNGGAIVTVTLSGAAFRGITTFGINATSVSLYHFVACDSGTNIFWLLVGSQVNQVI